MRPQEFHQSATDGGGEEVHELMIGRFASIVGRTLAPPTMDTSFAFLSKVVQHRTERIFLLNSCNGLFLFGLFGVVMDAYYTTQEVGYIVCNPATKQWVRVPGCPWIDDDPSIITLTEHTSLLFDPAVSSHFHLVLFWDHLGAGNMTRTTIHSYSSETGLWSHNAAHSIEERQGSLENWRFHEISEDSLLSGFPTAFVNGFVYLILERELILKVDPQGKTQCIIPAPPMGHVGADNNYVLFVGQSQGILHCIVEEGLVEYVPPRVPSCCHRRWKSCGLSVWVLQDSNTPKWDLKHKMSNMEVFGKKSCEGMVDYHVVTVHPDCNVIFFLQHSDALMVSYDMDYKEARALQSFKNEYGPITPYTPYLSDLFVGVAGAHKEAIEVVS